MFSLAPLPPHCDRRLDFLYYVKVRCPARLFSTVVLRNIFPGASSFVQAALAGGICCSITHGALTPVDVVKTRIQLDPAKYNKGMIGGFKQVIAAEGTGALLTGLGATASGYFVQGWFKFGGVEFFKINFAGAMGEQVRLRER